MTRLATLVARSKRALSISQVLRLLRRLSLGFFCFRLLLDVAGGAQFAATSSSPPKKTKPLQFLPR
jgi:hypothetical protein